MRFISAEEVRERLTYPLCIAAVRAAMIALSKGETRQLLRSIIPLADGRAFGVMPGALAADGPFGAKLISVNPANAARGRPSHLGLVVLFDAETGEAVCCVDAGEVTAIRTAAASAVATDALALPDAGVMAILGTGDQAITHARAIACVRFVKEVRIWGRSPDRATKLAAALSRELGLPIAAVENARDAVAGADIICTVTPAATPILFSDWVRDGAHINAVGSSVAGPAEIDNALVARSRFVADYRPGVLAQGGEFLNAKAAGLIGDEHIVAEIGEVLAGAKPGRTTPADVTIYKSLGHVVQDLASAQLLYDGPQD